MYLSRALGLLSAPAQALISLEQSLITTIPPLPAPSFSVGASDMYYCSSPSSGELVFTVNGKGRPSGGRMREFSSVYERIDPWLAHQLASGYSFLRPHAQIAPSFFANHQSATDHAEWVTNELSELFFTGCVGVYNTDIAKKHGLPLIVCSLIVEESSGKLRLIWNAKPVNIADSDGHVKYETFTGILPFLEKDVLCFKTDMRSGYFQIPMRDCDAPYLAFIWNGIIYYWRVLPFGLRSAPKFFERCTQPLKSRIRLLFKLVCLFYLDDMFFATYKSRLIAEPLRQHILAEVTSLGWVLVKPKTTDLSTLTELLGMCVDTHTQIISVSSSRQAKFLSLFSDLSALPEGSQVTARLIARFAGYLVSMEPGVWFSQRLSYPFMYSLKGLHEQEAWDCAVTLSPMCSQALSLIRDWWSWARGKPFRLPDPSVTLISDSSSFAYGGVYVRPLDFQDFLSISKWDVPASSTVYRMWRNPELLHINMKELEAFTLTVTEFLPRLRNQHFSAAIDNTTAASYVRKGGGAVRHLAEAAWRLSLVLINARAKLLHVQNIKSEDNPTDGISRINESKSMWALDPRVFQFIMSCARNHGLPDPTVDAFSDERTNLLPYFVSRFFCSSAVGTDFFSTTSVLGKVLWCNPPFSPYA